MKTGRIGEKSCAIAINHINRGGAQGGDPHRAAILGPIGTAGGPTEICLRAQHTGGNEAKPPVVGRVRCGGGIYGAHSVNGRAIRGDETRPGSHRHGELVVASRRHRHRSDPGFGGRFDVDVRRIGIVKVNVGRIAVGGGTDRSVIIRAPGTLRIKREPVHRISGVLMANHQIRLHRQRRSDPGTIGDAAVIQIGFALIQYEIRHPCPANSVRAGGINGHDRVVLRRLHKHAHIVHQAICHILPDGADVVGAPLRRIQNRYAAGNHRAGGRRPMGAGDHDGLGGANMVAAVILDNGRIARLRHNHIGERDNGPRRQAIRIMRQPRRNTMSIIAITPDLRGGLRRGTRGNFVAVLPLVVINHRAILHHMDGNGGQDARSGASHNCVVGLINLGLRQRHIKILNHCGCASRPFGQRQKRQHQAYI